MAHDSKKRFQMVMDKLFYAPKTTSNSVSSSGLQMSRGQKRQSQLSVPDLGGKKLRWNAEDGHQRFSASTESPQTPLCRPWDRGDLLKRLATFKSMTWFAKPKVVDAVNCARRGWINVDADIIACESCGARLIFNTPASWTQYQVEKAALVFSLKLDNGHKLLCPWIDNSCDEKLAQFPPSPPLVLVENYRERCSILLQLSALPQVSSSVIECIRSSLLEEFLENYSVLMYHNGSASNSLTELADEHGEGSAKLYYQALKLFSLCGWSPRLLPYQVDCHVGSDLSSKNTNILNSSGTVTEKKNANIFLHSVDTDGSLGSDEKSSNHCERQMDPNSVVLDCNLCGATVGLWAYATVPRPVELLRLVGYTDVNGEKDSEVHDLGSETNLRSCGGLGNRASDNATILHQRSSTLNLTIAGGPPPTKQDFKAIISLPIIGQNLRTRISCDSEFRAHICDGKDTQSDFPNAVTSDDCNSSGMDTTCVEEVPLVTHAESSRLAYGLESNVEYNNSIENDLIEDRTGLDVQRSLNSEENCIICSRIKNPVNRETAIDNTGRDLRKVHSVKATDFDPIRQHRHYCPWISSSHDCEPGWKLTLSALYHQNESSHPSPKKSTPTSIVKVDDPIGSVRKLFTSPSTKRMKPTSLSSQSTEK